MTKDEILKKYCTSKGYIDQTCRLELFSSMEEYAKQQALLFYEHEEGEPPEDLSQRYDSFLRWQKTGLAD